jgi:hypothetical protein
MSDLAERARLAKALFSGDERGAPYQAELFGATGRLSSARSRHQPLLRAAA